MLLSNRKHFDQLEYRQNPVIRESKLIYHEFPHTNRLIDYSFRHTKVDLEDSLLVTLEDVDTEELELTDVNNEESDSSESGENYSELNYSEPNFLKKETEVVEELPPPM